MGRKGVAKKDVWFWSKLLIETAAVTENAAITLVEAVERGGW